MRTAPTQRAHAAPTRVEETALERPQLALTDSAQDVVLERCLVEQRAYRKLLTEARVDHVDLVGVRAWVWVGIRLGSGLGLG